MFAPADGTVLNVDLDTLFGRCGGSQNSVYERVATAMRRHDLRVHVIVLCHGQNPARWETTARLCSALKPVRDVPGVDLTVSYQGGSVPAGLTGALDKATSVLADHPNLIEPNGAPVPVEGKTEHLLGCLAALARQPGDPHRRFVVFLDNDYVVYDPVNVFALYAPWALGFSSAAHGPSDPRFAGVQFAKGGSLRLDVASDVAKLTGDRTWGFLDLLEAALHRCVPQAPPLTEQLPPGFIPTIDGLRHALGPPGFAELETAIEQVTKHGGRSSRALSLWLASRRDHLVESWLSRFSFLLHGDQGATLAAWSAMELAPGYGLEISFLINALFRPGLHGGRIVNSLGLPHAHLPKDEADNFAMGVEMFTLIQQLLQGMTSRSLHGPGSCPAWSGQSWSHFSPTKLGYKQVDLALSAPRVPALYPPLTTLRGPK